MSYFSKFEQNVKTSAGNTSTVDLAGGATFTGTADSTYGVSGIQVAFYANQNCTIYVDQSTDDAPVSGAPHWDITDTFNYYAGNSFGVTVQAISAYVRVRVTNLNASTGTTGLRLATALCPIVEAVPRSLDAHGLMKTAVYNDEDLYGFSSENTPMGEKRTIQPIRIVGAAFEGTTVDPNFWTVTNTNGGTTTQANAQVTLATNTTANGATIIASFRRARYVSGSSMCYRSIVQLSAGVTDNKRRWGIGYGASMPTITDGAWFQIDGSTLSIVTCKGTSQTKVDSGSFNGNLGLSYSPGTAVKTYEIYWTNSEIIFVIGDEILHTVSASSATWSDTMSFFIFMDSVNSNSITSNNTLLCRVASIQRLGALQSQPTHKYQSGNTTGVICKYGVGNLVAMIVGATANSAVVTIYDGTSTGGTIMYQTTTHANGLMQHYDFKGIPFFTGLFFTQTGGAANVMLIYE